MIRTNSNRIIQLAMCCAVFVWSSAAVAGDFVTTSVAVSSTYTGAPGWGASNLNDNDLTTLWSSALHTSSTSEYIAYWWGSMQTTNYVKLRPRYSGSTALCFPTAFSVYYSNGSSWVPVGTYTNYPTPNRGDWIILPLPGDYIANGIHIVATTLSPDNLGNYAFQLAEAKAGYDAGFAQLRFGGNNAVLGAKTQIAGVSANAFNPNRLSNWNYDDRGIVLAANPGTNRNIYSPQAVYLGGTTWRLYMHGYDGVSAPVNDRIYTTVTFDNFLTYDAHYLQIDHGMFENVGNESVVWSGGSNWRMTYTTYPSGGVNKTGYATSSDGASWTPSAGSSSYLLTMTGYTNWSAGDFNGVNPTIKDSAGTWHYYFMDSRFNAGVEHATSSNGVDFTYSNRAVVGFEPVQDIKAFSYAGTTYYVACGYDSVGTWTSVQTNLSTLVPVPAFNSSPGSSDAKIVTTAWVQDGTRIYGMLYGASPTSVTDNNKEIFARWLQKKVVFQNTVVRWDVSTGFGPTIGRLATSNAVETGNFYVYDTDGTTLLYTSPLISVRPGDLWNYAGP